MLRWRKKPVADSVTVAYRVLPFSFSRVYSHKSRSVVDSNYIFSAMDYNRGNGNRSFVSYNPIEYSGSYGRGISLGNNQDVVLNSNFNLQVNGYIMDSIKVEAAITDNTVPFQPEGNTSTLQEFDQLSIRLSKGSKSLTLGDYNLDRPQSYFLNFTKRVQGIYFNTEDRLGRKLSNKAGFSASIAKGEFARNIFTGGEGNQGPYRLIGNNGEQLFVVLAGTEKVYVDNILQERGENADYIINYNTNEVRFMPRRLITQYSRIQVEFEYRANNYLNSLLFLYDELSVGKKLKFRLNAYSNQDAKNQPYQQNLSGAQKQFLSTIGDSIQNAYIANISRDTFGAGKILYEIRDTTIGSTVYDSVYVYSTNQAKELYSVSFSYTGSGKGDYIIATGSANGRAYSWVGPGLGDYTAVSLLVTPKMQQVFTLASSYQIDSFKKLSIELAASNKDPNLFSATDNETHLGVATKVIYEEQRQLGAADTNGYRHWKLSNTFNYEYVQSTFRPIAPYRSVEFGRDWSVPLSGISPDEHWMTLGSRLAHDRYGTVDYTFSYYTRGTDYKGYKNAAAYKYNSKRINTGVSVSMMNAADSATTVTFLKPYAFAEYNFRKILKTALGSSYYAEHSDVRYNSNDSLSASAFYFDISSVYLKTLEQQRYRGMLTLSRRNDYLPYGTGFRKQTHGDNVELQLGLAQWKQHQVNFTGTYRQLHIDNGAAAAQQPEETFLGRLEYNGNLWRKLLSLGTLYEFGSGREQKRNFTYVQVPAGQGVYNWIDYNNDGVQQLNEFVPGLYPDQKLYIRVFTPSDEYVKVNNINFNQTISLDPANLFVKPPAHGWKKWLSLMSDQFSLQVVNKILATEGIGSYSPIGNNYRDTAVIIANTAINNTFYYNRSSPVWGMDYNLLSNSGRQLLTYGLTGTSSVQHLIKFRLAMSRAVTMNLGGRSGRRTNESGINDGSSYNQQYWAAEPALTWLNKSILRITTQLRYEARDNAAAYGGEKARISSVNIESRYSQTAAGIIQLRLTYSNIDYNGLNNAPVTYVMLDGLKTGNNFLWYINWQRRISKGIELSIEYEGRKAGADKPVHTGRMAIRAVL